MMNRKPSFLRYSLTIFFSYLLSIHLLLLITCLILLRTVFSPIYMMNRVDSSKFSLQALTEIQEVYISLGAASGIPGDVMLSVLSYRHIDDAVKAEICAVYNTGRAYDFDRYENEIYDVLYDFAIKEGFEPAPDLERGLRDLARLCVDEFAENLISPVIGMLGAASVQYSRYLHTAIAVTSILAALTAALLPMINRRVSGWACGYMYALGSAAVICAAIPVFTFITGFTRQWNITPLSYNRLFTSWINGLAEGYLAALIPLTLLFAVLLTIWIPRRNYYSGN